MNIIRSQVSVQHDSEKRKLVGATTVSRHMHHSSKGIFVLDSCPTQWSEDAQHDGMVCMRAVTPFADHNADVGSLAGLPDRLQLLLAELQQPEHASGSRS